MLNALRPVPDGQSQEVQVRLGRNFPYDSSFLELVSQLADKICPPQRLPTTHQFKHLLCPEMSVSDEAVKCLLCARHFMW